MCRGFQPGRAGHNRAGGVQRELVRYVLRTGASERAMAQAERVLPLGGVELPVLRAASARHAVRVRSRMTDLDGHEYVDFTMDMARSSRVMATRRSLCRIRTTGSQHTLREPV
jgi:hypothetical protein